MCETNKLKNRNLHISCTLEIPKCQITDDNVTLNVTLDEMQILTVLKQNPKTTQKQLSMTINKSDRTVKRIISSLQEKGYIERINGKRYGYWKILK